MTDAANVVAISETDDSHPVSRCPLDTHLHCFETIHLPVTGIAVNGEESAGVNYDTRVTIYL